MTILAFLIDFLEHSKYVLLFAGAFFEGPVVMLTGGLLWKLGQVDFLPAYLALTAGDVAADVAWYFIGYHGARRFVARYGHFVHLTSEMIDKAEVRFHHYHTRILIISKLTMGFGLAVPILTVAGMLRVPFNRYFTINLLAGFVWTAFVMWLGSHFGNFLIALPRDLQLLTGIGFVIGFYIFVQLLSKGLQRVDW